MWSARQRRRTGPILAACLSVLLAPVPLACGAETEDVCRADPSKCPHDATAPGYETSIGPDAAKGTDGAKPADAATAPYQHEDVSVQTVYGWVTSGKTMTLIDVREAGEYATGYIAGAINLPWISGALAQSLGQVPTDRPVVVYCQSGNRSDGAAAFLVGKGYKPVYDMLGGIGAWKAAGYPVQ